MDTEITLLILLALSFPIIAIAALVMSIGNREQVRQLRRVVALLEHKLTLAGQGAPQPQPEKPAAPSTPEPTPVAQKPVVHEPPQQSAEPSPAPQPASSKTPSLEENLGSRWAVWVGGLALALGGIFLVRYSIEQGLLGPAARVAFGLLFAAALLGGGEWLRRRETKLDIAALPSAHIPGVLTAAGTVSAFATLFAAYALYGLISPAVTFILLGLVATGTLLAAALHGPSLAALGLLGATAVPALVSTGEPNPWGLFIYLLFVSAAAVGVARLRNWCWLRLAAGLIAEAWGLLVADIEGASLHSGALAAFALAMTLLLALDHWLGEEDAPAPEWITTALIPLFGLLLVPMLLAEQHAAPALAIFTAALALSLALAWKLPRLSVLAPAMVPLAALALLAWDMSPALLTDPTLAYPALSENPPLPARLSTFLSIAFLHAALLGLAGAWGAWQNRAAPAWRPLAWATAGAGAPIVLLALSYWRVAALIPDLRFAGAAMVLAAAFAWLTLRFAQEEHSASAAEMATAAYATGAVTALGLMLAMSLREGFLSVALAFLALGLAWVETLRPIRAMRPLAVAAGLIVLWRVLDDPLIVRNVGAMPIFNALLWGYGAPAAAFAGAAVLFRRRRDDNTVRVFEGLALLFTALLFVFEIRHWAWGGLLRAPGVSLAELGLDAVVAFLLAAATSRLERTRASIIFSYAIRLLGIAGAGLTLLGLLLYANPLFSSESIGQGLIINNLLLGYLLPAIAAGILAWSAKESRPGWYVKTAGLCALLLAFAYITLQTRAFFQGDVLNGGSIEDAELYSYSVVWLLFGIALLAAGIFTGERMVRMASGAILVLVVLKAFLVDMSGLTGVLRALSFMGLGAVLISIGLLYQRLLARQKS